MKITPPHLLKIQQMTFQAVYLKIISLKYNAMKSNYFNKNLLPNFKTLGLLFLTVLLFSACDDEPVPPAPGKKPAENLTFQKVYKAFATSGSFTTAEILAGVQGTKYGYTVKNITNLTPNNLVTFSSSTKTLNFSGGLGSFTATIVLEHSAKEDATITGTEFQIYSDKLQVSNDGKVTLKSGVDKSNHYKYGDTSENG